MPTPNNTYYWTGSGSLNTLTNWTPTVPSGQLNENNLFVFSGSQGAPTSATATFGSWQFDANFNSYTEIGGNFLLRAGNFSQGAYTLYVGDGKVVASTGTGVQYLLHTASGRNELWCYIGSGAEYRTTSYYGTNGRVRIYGPGKFYFAYNAISSQLQPNSQGVVIDTGTAAVRGVDYATNTSANPWGTGTLAFVSGSSRLNIESGGGSRSFSNPVSFPSGATFQIDSGSTITFSNVTSAGGTVTIAGTGTTTFTQALTIPGIAFTANGTLNLGSGSVVNSSITGSTGTLNATGCTFSGVTGTSHTSIITGNVTVNSSDMNSSFNGAVSATAGDTYLRGASAGSIGSVGYANIYLYAPFTTNSGTTSLTGGGTEGTPIGGVSIYGPSGSIASGRTIQMSNRSWLRLLTGGSISSPVSVANDSTIIRLQTADASVCTFSSNVTASTKATGSVRVQAALNGVAVFAGSLTTGGAAFDINADAGFTGTVRLTGSGFSGGAVTLSQGTLHINSTSTTALGAGLTVNSSTTLACSSTAAYAAQLSGPVTFASGSTFRFGAPV